MASAKKQITVLTPVFNEADNLLLFQETVEKVLLSSTIYDFKVLFIDDGSQDLSWKIIQDICKRNQRFTGIRLSRNFGSHIALSAGFREAAGDALSTLACDLQDPPETILEFLKEWEKGAKIAWGKRKSREDSFWRVIASKMFFFLISRYAMPKHSKFTTGSFFLADRQVVDAFLQFHEHNRITFALVAWTGFEQSVVLYDRKRRIAGSSGWTLNKMLKSMYDTFIGFSDMPIRIVTWLGTCLSLFNIGFSVYLMMSWFISKPLSGWTSLMLVISIFFGIHFLLLGLVGEYLRRIYTESVRRPLYFISDKTEAIAVR
jgi:dolichol-phosphate mannosyltransferase